MIAVCWFITQFSDMQFRGTSDAEGLIWFEVRVVQTAQKHWLFQVD